MKFAGIYVIQNIINNKLYIGSSNNIHKRKISHFGNLRRNKHNNRKLQYSFNKYGEENFVFCLIESIDNLDNLLIREQLWIDFFNPEFNIIPFADRREFSDETKKRLSESHKGNKHTEKAKIKIGLASKGNKYRLGCKISEAQKEKISNARIGKRGRKGLDNPLFGKKRPKEIMIRCVETRLKNKIPLPNCYCGKPYSAKGLCKYHYKIEYRKNKQNANII